MESLVGSSHSDTNSQLVGSMCLSTQRVSADHACRLKCGEKNESMLHMIECRHAAPFWQACIKFCKLVLNEEPFANTIDAVIFNMNGGELIGEPARAFLRHAVGNYYAAATRVSTEGELFRWQTTYHWTLLKFRDAVLRRCHGIRRHYVARKHTHLVSVVSETERMAYPELVGITEEGFYNLNPKLTAEIDAAEANAAKRDQHNAPLPPNRPHELILTFRA